MKINSLLDLKVFMFVADTHSFTEAAELSGLSRSAVGKIIAKLEDSLQQRLFHRTTRVVRLSDEGTIFYGYVQRILQEAEDAEQALSLDQEPQGKIRIALPIVFGRLHVMPLLWKFKQIYPKIEMEVFFSDDFSDLVRERIDIAIRIGRHQDLSLVQKVLTYHQYYTCVSPSYLDSSVQIEQLSDLRAYRCLGYLHEGKVFPWRYRVNSKEIGWMPESSMYLQDVEAIKDAVLAGFGIAQLGSFLVREDINSGRLRILLPELMVEKEPICAVFPSKKYLSPKVRKLLEYLDHHWKRSII